MAVAIVDGSAVDLAALAAFVAGAQADLTRHIAYPSEDAGAIAEEIEGIDAWRARTAVALDDEAIVGALVADVDAAVGRVWWWGPYAPTPDVADALYAAARAAVPAGIVQEEACGTTANAALAAFCARHDMVPGPASVALEWHAPAGQWCEDVERYEGAFGDELAALHDALFADAHSTGAQFRDRDGDDDLVVIAVSDDTLVGYAVGQVQADGSGYIDFVGVAPAHQRRGVGSRLVLGITAALVDAGAGHLHLTVRDSNSAARALYRRTGFTEAIVLRPYRKGFALT